MRNFFVCLMVSQGVPMFYMGDEYGHTKGGNNNTYCHDHYVNYFRWYKMEEQSSDLYRFCRLMTKFRKMRVPWPSGLPNCRTTAMAWALAWEA
ncbi:hypothetical protein ACP70R_015728 [Stipagrostis hirtigluma subsp. patula]